MTRTEKESCLHEWEQLDGGKLCRSCNATVNADTPAVDHAQARESALLTVMFSGAATQPVLNLARAYLDKCGLLAAPRGAEPRGYTDAQREVRKLLRRVFHAANTEAGHAHLVELAQKLRVWESDGVNYEQLADAILDPDYPTPRALAASPPSVEARGEAVDVALASFRAVLSSDSYAASFQTLGQYRSALCGKLDSLIETARVVTSAAPPQERVSEAEPWIAAERKNRELEAQLGGLTIVRPFAGDEDESIRLLHRADLRLKELGWRDARYAPKNTPIECIEVGCAAVLTDCHRDDIGFWHTAPSHLSEHDSWPIKPVLFRLTAALSAETGREEQ